VVVVVDMIFSYSLLCGREDEREGKGIQPAFDVKL